MVTVFVGIGSNVDRRRAIAMAVVALRERFGEVRCSSVYESAPVGFEGDPFLNLVVEFSTEDVPDIVRAALHSIERSARAKQLDGVRLTRELDLDLLLYGEMVSEQHRLPRADVDRYAFVLCPLSELAGQARHPVSGKTYLQLWSEFDASAQSLERVALELGVAHAPKHETP